MMHNLIYKLNHTLKANLLNLFNLLKGTDNKFKRLSQSQHPCWGIKPDYQNALKVFAIDAIL